MKQRYLWIAAIPCALLLGALVVGDRQFGERLGGVSPRSSVISSEREEKPTLLGRSSATVRHADAPAGARQAYTLDDKRVLVPDGNARDVIRALRARAEAGDSTAALAIYLKLKECHDVISRGPSNEERAAYESIGAGEDKNSKGLAALQSCEDVDELLEERSKWLSQAAEAGVEEAQLLYSADPEPIIGKASDMLRNPEAVSDYKKKSRAYLEQMVRKGNVDATLALANAYEAGVIVERDPVRAYSYYKAAELMAPGMFDSEFMAVQRRRLPVESRGPADHYARQLYSQCCSR